MSAELNRIDADIANAVQVRDVMITRPKIVDSTISVGRAQELFADDHVHMLLVVEQRRLIATLTRTDLPIGYTQHCCSALVFAVMKGRCIREDEPALEILSRMSLQKIRRLAVVDEHLHVVGLLCLKRSGNGFCSDDDVRARGSSLHLRPSTSR
ncbi:CBS domain-containing protein [Rhodococcus sp. 06-156-3C]|uniref:CBS domain-containing protein n=1 Tax=Nocardiaceae TaxID=85025 RepID=UPI000522F748|nr:MULTISPECIES: CBS domain-containing protein [Rhodococcus]OZD18180.1 CBS domain-containing protein [Rhodococcus sp. 06-156-4C]OZD18777.1 CBS domain-containing protein [Rhodococcus sp. 06-156-3C]OZD22287.1 CBS domain-containing protein [Rhodococcus sp. 06-156-4a]OZD34093.1 CBS domain-containing protein [Rhodococcus sp. 06-156-3b]OZD38830.1 CBS domain-containing protein [Rhodococcus sp. 06-156-3]